MADDWGMTEEQYRTFRLLTSGYGDQDANGVDHSLLRDNLKLTPAQRLERMESAARALLQLKHAAGIPKDA
ncbi:MAG: hypothetical protein ACYCW6_01185 [Candidatus Xenobia bacterium]